MRNEHASLTAGQKSDCADLRSHSVSSADMRKIPSVYDIPFAERACIITSPRQLAEFLNIPIVMITIMAEENLLLYDGFGLAPGRILGKLSKIAHMRCQEGAYFKADIGHDPDFAAICTPADISDSRFFIGVPVYDQNSNIIGTAALLDRRSNIMTRRNLFGNLHDAARSFIQHKLG